MNKSQAFKTIICLAKYFSPSTTAAGIRAENFTAALAEAGWRVIVVTSGQTPAWQEYSRQMVLCRVSERGEIPALLAEGRCPHLPWWRILPGPDPHRRLCRAMFTACHFLLQKYPCSVVFASGPPFSLLTVAGEIAHIHRLPLVVELRDAWYSAMPWPYSNFLQRRSARKGEKIALNAADRIITVTDEYQRILAEKYGPAIADKITTIRHGFNNLSDLPPSDAPVIATDSDPGHDTFTIAYIGQLRGIDITSQTAGTKIFRRVLQMGQKLLLGANFCENLRLDYMSPHYLMEAVSLTAQASPAFASAVRLIFVGQSYPQIDSWAEKLQLVKNLTQLGPLPPAQARMVAQRADLLVITLYGIKNCVYHWCVPSKLYMYLAAGRPILSLQPPGESTDLVRRSGLGFFAPPDDPDAIARQLLALWQQHKDGAIQVNPDAKFIEQFDLSLQQRKFIELFDSLRK